jgi:hypothetical protein
MDGEKRGQDVQAAGGGSVAGGGSPVNNDRPPDSEQTRPGREKVPARERFRQWSPKKKSAVLGIVAAPIAVIVAAAIALIPPLLTNGGPSSVGPSSVCAGKFQIKGNNNCSINNNNKITNNYAPTASSNPRAQIAQQTGSYSEQGFTTAILDRDDSIVALYLKSGMTATTLYQGTSAILFGFEEVDQNADPIQSGGAVALVKTFQAGGFKVNENLQDSYLLGELTGGYFPGMFRTPLAAKGYTGGFQDGTFIGSLLFWIVQRALYAGPTAEDIQVIQYLVSQGADCKVPLSFLNYDQGNYTAGTGPYKELFPIIQSCAD